MGPCSSLLYMKIHYIITKRMENIDVFISYARADGGPYARALKLALKEQFSVYMDEDITPGEKYRERIAEVLHYAKCVLVVWSERAVESEWVKDEADEAAKFEKLLQIKTGEDVEVPLGHRQQNWLVIEMDDQEQLCKEEVDKVKVSVGKLVRKLGIDATFRQTANDIRGRLQEKLQNYVIEGEVGRGSSAVVYEANTAIRDGRKFAIKVTTAENMFLNRGLFEAFLEANKISQRLEHENIADDRTELFDDLLVVKRKFISGCTLDRKIADGHEYSMSQIQQTLIQIASALSHAHEKDVIHGNLKPSKIMIDEENRIYVMDFGRLQQNRLKEYGIKNQLLNSPRYMSPEQCLEGETTSLSDQYALGVIGYELIAGAPLFEGSSAYAIMNQHVRTIPRDISFLNDACPKTLARAVMKMLSKNAEDRFATMKVAIHELRKSHTWSQDDRGKALECLNANDNFIDLFYENFIGKNNIIKKIFAVVDRVKQVQKLRGALVQLLSEETTDELIARLVQSHKSEYLNKAHFALFKAALQETVWESSFPYLEAEKLEVIAAWDNIVDDFESRITQFIQRDEVDERSASA